MEQATETEEQKEERLKKKLGDACSSTFHSQPVPSIPVSNSENEHSDDENLGKNDQSQNKNRGRVRGKAEVEVVLRLEVVLV
ncbi:unnamed protein product [Brachionus calyciflorus]|uniref:Uncharacterized protein n=1 Tax=Brachionus calyciflorus TaxID=104777 RepID=A0A813S240_9BILA|nr:unnamed protein product [Brachionus calyciflorus]